MPPSPYRVSQAAANVAARSPHAKGKGRPGELFATGLPRARPPASVAAAVAAEKQQRPRQASARMRDEVLREKAALQAQGPSDRALEQRVQKLLKAHFAAAAGGSDARETLTKVLNMLQTFRMQPSCRVGWRTYERVLFFVAERGNERLFESVSKMAREDGVEESAMMRAAEMTLHAALRQYAKVEELFRAEEARSQRTGGSRRPPPLVMFRRLQECYVQTGDEDAAFALFQQACEAHPEVEERVNEPNSYVQVFLRALQSYETLFYYIDTLSKGLGMRVSPEVVQIVFKFASRVGDREMMRPLLTLLLAASGHRPNVALFNTYFKGYLTLKQYDGGGGGSGVRGYFKKENKKEEDKKDESKKEGAGGTAWVDGPGKRSTKKDVIAELTKMKAAMEEKHGVAPNAITFCVLLSVVYRSESLWATKEGEAQVVAFARALQADVLGNPARAGVQRNSRFWGKLAEVFGRAKEATLLEEHLQLWQAKGPPLTRGALVVVTNAFRLCGLQKRVLETSLLLRERDGYYEKRRDEPVKAFDTKAATETVAARVELLAEEGAGKPVSVVRREGGEEDSGAEDCAVLFGVPSRTTEAELLLLLRTSGEPVQVNIVHDAPDTLTRVFVRYGTVEERDALIRAQSGASFGRQRLRVLRASPTWTLPTPEQTQRLKIAQESHLAHRAGLHKTALSDSIFKKQAAWPEARSRGTRRSVRR